MPFHLEHSKLDDILHPKPETVFRLNLKHDFSSIDNKFKNDITKADSNMMKFKIPFKKLTNPGDIIESSLRDPRILKKIDNKLFYPITNKLKTETIKAEDYTKSTLKNPF